MDKFFSNTKKIIFHKQKDILSSAMILSAMIGISKLFGFYRIRIQTGYFSKEELGIFLAAFRIPDFIFEILITGALSSAFIPLFIKYKNDPQKLTNNISAIVNFIIVALFILMLITFFCIPIIIPLITPGFNSEEIRSVVSIARVILIFQLPFMVLGNILSGISQANKIFILTALATVLYNVGIIIGTIFFSSQYGIYGPVIGVLLGSLLFFIIQLPIIIISHFKYNPTSLNKQTLHEFVTLFIPRLLSVISTQIDLFIDLTLSSLFGPAGYTIFFFSQHLQLLPVSFFGIAYGQASLPYLSELFNSQKITEMKKIFVDSILQLLFLSVPISFIFIFTRTPLVRFFFGGDKFDWEGTVQTARTLSFFALSIPFHTIFYFITRTFYATHNTKTPFFVNFFSVMLNASLSYIFVFVLKLPVWALAFSFSISVTTNVLLLLLFFYRQIGGFSLKRLVKNSFLIYLASFISALGSYFVMRLLDELILDTTRTINVFILLAVTTGIFGILYLTLSFLLHIEEIYLFGKLIVKINQLKKRILEVYIDVG